MEKYNACSFNVLHFISKNISERAITAYYWIEELINLSLVCYGKMHVAMTSILLQNISTGWI